MKTFKTTGLALIVLLAMTVLSIGCPNVSGVKPTDSGNSGAGIGGGETPRLYPYNTYKYHTKSWKSTYKTPPQAKR
ncbi:hypothetical protein [Treponema pedis]|uniref:hypothetical protein n=1 Tax=Treponema pedis TaxID=409322 RepID=UPI00041AE0DB|nr:hypothetical protein [Treponema pedis]